jgi:transposase
MSDRLFEGELEMARKRMKPYSAEFRAEVLRLAEGEDRTDSDIERDLGLSAGLISRWRERYGRSGNRPEITPRSGEAPDAEAEILRLRRELETVRQERDILKKAIAIFSREKS